MIIVIEGVFMELSNAFGSKKKKLINFIYIGVFLLLIGISLKLDISHPYRILSIGILLLCTNPIWTFVKSNRLVFFVNIFIVLINAIIMIEVGNCNTFSTLSVSTLLLNIATIFCVFLFIYAVTGQAMLSLNSITVLSAILAIAEYYVYTFRSIPLVFSYIAELPTAMSVLKNYEFDLSINVVFVIAFCIYTILFNKLNFNNSHYIKFCPKKSIRCALSIGSVILIAVLFRTDIIPIKTESWNQQLVYHQNGFLVQSFKSVLSPKIIKPKGYSAEVGRQLTKKIYDKATSATLAVPENYPDIILIVNESYYDMQQLVPFTSDTPITPYTDSLTNTVRGFAVNPNITTGNSEFELLCSSSMKLVKDIVPFNSLNLAKINSFVKSLKDLGYYTIGMHPAPGSNYNRVNAYDNLGFDDTYFIDDMTVELNYIRDFVSDESCYKQIIEYFKNDDIDTPKFFHCLTIQNHAGYETGLIDYNVNITSGVENTDEFREYLSLIQESDRALEILIDYFSNSERPTIICMVGDHPPVMLDRFSTDLESWIKFMGTPVLLWANFSIEETNLGYFGMPNLSNIIKEYANLPMTPYEQYISEVSKELPIIHSNFYMDKNNKIYTYSDESPYDMLINQYDIVQYENLKGNCKSLLSYKN